MITPRKFAIHQEAEITYFTHIFNRLAVRVPVVFILTLGSSLIVVGNLPMNIICDLLAIFMGPLEIDH
jgi:hypothetical protein